MHAPGCQISLVTMYIEHIQNEPYKMRVTSTQGIILCMLLNLNNESQTATTTEMRLDEVHSLAKPAPDLRYLLPTLMLISLADFIINSRVYVLE